MKATTIKSFVFNAKALGVTAMFLMAGNLEATTRRFLPIEGTPVEREWIPRFVGRLFEAISVFVSGVVQLPPG